MTGLVRVLQERFALTSLLTRIPSRTEEVEPTDTATELAVVVADAAFVGIASTRHKYVFVKHIPDTAEQVHISTKQFHVVGHGKIVPNIGSIVEVRRYFRIRNTPGIA